MITITASSYDQRNISDKNMLKVWESTTFHCLYILFKDKVFSHSLSKQLFKEAQGLLISSCVHVEYRHFLDVISNMYRTHFWLCSLQSIKACLTHIGHVANIIWYNPSYYVTIPRLFYKWLRMFNFFKN